MIHSRRSMSSRSAASETSDLERFGRFCAALMLDSGGPMELEPFQHEMLAGYFAGSVETLILIPKKNGKSTLLGALALFHLIITPDAECVIGAASRDQATILYDQAAGFVRRSPGLAQRVDVKRGYREMRSRRDAGRIRVLAADVDTADGVIPTLALVDELHRHKSAGLYGIFRDGLGPRKGQMITISTAGDHEMSALGQMRNAAMALPRVTRSGAHTVARSATSAYVMHEWALRKDDDIDDMRVVKRANPASWQTLEALQARHTSPSMLPWQWARFACGLWVSSEAWWVDAEDWHKLGVPDRIRPGESITLGFDGSRVGDATALIACRLSDGLLQPLQVWEAPADLPTWEVPAGEVDARLEFAMENFRVVRGYFDPPLWRSEIDAWGQMYGEKVVQRFETSKAKMMGAVERFRTDVATERIRHTGDVTLTAHVLNAQTREVRGGGYWLTKDTSGSMRKIDAAVAAVLAYEARAQVIAAQENRSRVPLSWN
jgi:phage terminase large subunit-like protein